MRILFIAQPFFLPSPKHLRVLYIIIIKHIPLKYCLSRKPGGESADKVGKQRGKGENGQFYAAFIFPSLYFFFPFFPFLSIFLFSFFLNLLWRKIFLFLEPFLLLILIAHLPGALCLCTSCSKTNRHLGLISSLLHICFSPKLSTVLLAIFGGQTLVMKRHKGMCWPCYN